MIYSFSPYDENAMNQEMVLLIKGEVIHSQYNAFKVTKCLSRSLFVSTSINSLVVWTVGCVDC